MENPKPDSGETIQIFRDFACDLHNEIGRRFPNKFSSVSQFVVARICSKRELADFRNVLKIEREQNEIKK